jgi:NADH pyrophosphatase NudC (nudix superfamily)
LTAARVRDSIVPGSARLVEIHEEYTLVTVECGRCGNRQEARSTARTTRCKECSRSCRVAVPADDPNVIPIITRRSA